MRILNRLFGWLVLWYHSDEVNEIKNVLHQFGIVSTTKCKSHVIYDRDLQSNVIQLRWKHCVIHIRLIDEYVRYSGYLYGRKVWSSDLIDRVADRLIKEKKYLLFCPMDELVQYAEHHLFADQLQKY